MPPFGCKVPVRELGVQSLVPGLFATPSRTVMVSPGSRTPSKPAETIDEPPFVMLTGRKRCSLKSPRKPPPPVPPDLTTGAVVSEKSRRITSSRRGQVDGRPHPFSIGPVGRIQFVHLRGVIVIATAVDIAAHCDKPVTDCGKGEVGSAKGPLWTEAPSIRRHIEASTYVAVIQKKEAAAIETANHI